MRHSLRIGIIASLAALAACEAPGPATAPISNRATPADARASKQSTTGSRMLVLALDLINDTHDIALVNDDGSNLVPISDGVPGLQPAWAPDGKRIVFASGAFAANPLSWSLFLMNDDGTGVTRLTAPPSGGLDQGPVGFARGVVFSRYDNATAVSAISLLDAEGGVTQLTSGALDDAPSPSPKGKTVAFQRNDGEIYVLDLGTGGLTNITNTPGCAEFDPAYAPSGKEIAFRRNDCGTVAGGIFVMNNDGTSVTRITTPPDGSIDDTPRWSPDGSRIAFNRSPLASMVPSVYVVNADGTNLRSILPADDTHGYLVSAWTRY